MQQQLQRPIRRTETQRANDDKQEVWPLSVREFMKLPASGLLSAGKRLTFLVKREAYNVKRGQGEIRAHGS